MPPKHMCPRMPTPFLNKAVGTKFSPEKQGHRQETLQPQCRRRCSYRINWQCFFNTGEKRTSLDLQGPEFESSYFVLAAKQMCKSYLTSFSLLMVKKNGDDNTNYIGVLRKFNKIDYIIDKVYYTII